ncbi:LacI family transcriptional regulator [Peribacillus deserti]|uniref:LacI family transcriptional regulator n=1 Tax=Peribacillus deserti TaxID=673318 RepID=A0ABS2QE82_9BACI|nr:LacI family DNA-binding transcriptional regulator [Peribacillus deserti]MBM7690818.1 LacI family transcriptional regulator [Peribacillus deserti]
MNDRKKITMQHIADRLQISKNSVSQALSGKPGVSDETRMLVQKTAEDLGYQYLTVRKAAKKNSPKNIALIASEYAFSLTSFFGKIYLSIEKEVHNRGMNLFIESINSDDKENLILPKLLSNHEIDGILILSHISTEYISAVIKTGIPTVLIDHHDPLLHADAILTNNRYGAYIAVEHLIRLGHKNIAYIGNTDISPSYQERLEGYLLALKRNNLEANPGLMFINVKENETEISHLIANIKELPSAWFCVNDGFGFHILSSLQHQGLAIPEEASICSFDNGQFSQYASPKITTMDIDLNFFGKKAVEQLYWRIQHKEEPFQEVLLSPKLLVRQSTSIKS